MLVPVPGARLCTQAFGDPADPCLLLVAGGAGSMDWWEDELCQRLAGGGRRVVRYDHRDTGRSTTGRPGAPDYDGQDLVRDCSALAAALGPDPVHLAGLSMGGGIAQSVALSTPGMVASLTLFSTTAVGGVDQGALPGPEPRVAATFAEPPVGPDRPGWCDPVAAVERLVEGARPFVGDLGFDEQRVRRTAERVVARSLDVAAAENHWLVAGGAGEALDVHDVGVPTLVLHGSSDPLFPLAHEEALARAIPDASLLVLEGVGHEYPPPSTWDVVVPALLAHTGGPRAR